MRGVEKVQVRHSPRPAQAPASNKWSGTVRLAEPRHAPAIARLYQQASLARVGDPSRGWLPPLGTAADVGWEMGGDLEYWVALDDHDNVVGTIAVSQLRTSGVHPERYRFFEGQQFDSAVDAARCGFASGQAVVLSRLAVDPSFRRQGIGMALYDAINQMYPRWFGHLAIATEADLSGWDGRSADYVPASLNNASCDQLAKVEAWPIALMLNSPSHPEHRSGPKHRLSDAPELLSFLCFYDPVLGAPPSDLTRAPFRLAHKQMRSRAARPRPPPGFGEDASLRMGDGFIFDLNDFVVQQKARRNDLQAERAELRKSARSS